MKIGNNVFTHGKLFFDKFLLNSLINFVLNYHYGHSYQRKYCTFRGHFDRGILYRKIKSYFLLIFLQFFYTLWHSAASLHYHEYLKTKMSQIGLGSFFFRSGIQRTSSTIQSHVLTSFELSIDCFDNNFSMFMAVKTLIIY